MNISREQLIAYLDDALADRETAEVERFLRQSEQLRVDLQQLVQARDRGEHTVGAIWRRERLTCLSRSELGSYILGVLEAAHQDYAEFHLETIGCPYCQANRADLLAQQKEGMPEADKRRRRYYESSAKLLRERT